MALDIRDESSDSQLILALYVEGDRWATARADNDVIQQMGAQFGLNRAAVSSELREALEKLQAAALDKVVLQGVKEEVSGSRRFLGRYVHRDHRDLTEGIVWYDVPNGVTEPDSVPALVRNKLRYVVHEQLVKGNVVAEELLGALK